MGARLETRFQGCCGRTPRVLQDAELLVPRLWPMRSPSLSPGACQDVTQSEAAHAAAHRKLLQSKAIAIENDLRATLRNFGLKVGMVGAVRPVSRSSWTISPI
jgi:hypothetical protein